MNGLQQLGHDDLRARVALALAGHNLNSDISDAVRVQGPSAVVDALSIPPRVLWRAERVLTGSEDDGLAILTPVSSHWPWAGGWLVSPEPLVLWATGRVEVLREPLIGLSHDPTPASAAEAAWASVEAATGLSDAGHVLLASACSSFGQLVLRAAQAMGGRWVAVSSELTRDTELAPLGPTGRGVMISATPPRPGSQLRARGDAVEWLSRLASTTVDTARGRVTCSEEAGWVRFADRANADRAGLLHG